MASYNDSIVSIQVSLPFDDMTSLSRPQSSAAMRAPSSVYPTSSLKYTSSPYSTQQNQLHTDPTALIASESRKFLSSRKGERPYTPSSVERDRDPQRQRSGSYSASSNGAASPDTYHHYRGLPPPVPDRTHPRTHQQQLGQFSIHFSILSAIPPLPSPLSDPFFCRTS